MTRKLNDLIEFGHILREIYGKTFQINDVRYEIAKKFGASKYIMTSILDYMFEFRIIQEIYPGVYELVEKKTKQEAEKEAKKESDKLLEDIKHAKPDKS